MISSWSHSKLGDFEKCKFLCWLKHDQRIPEPERPLRPGQTEHANDRGTRIHTAAENYVNGTVDKQIDELRAQFSVVIVTHSMQQAARVSQRPPVGACHGPASPSVRG